MSYKEIDKDIWENISERLKREIGQLKEEFNEFSVESKSYERNLGKELEKCKQKIDEVKMIIDY